MGSITIRSAEVNILAAESTAAGLRLTKAQAFRDLMWQEAERQRLGLPGGAELRKSRREVIRRYRFERRSRDPIDTLAALPEGATLTACGARLLEQDMR